MHKLEECVVIAMLFVVGLLFILMFSALARNKVILQFFTALYEYKKVLVLNIFHRPFSNAVVKQNICSLGFWFL